ncbi:MAG: glycosyltransferase [Acidimicrobiia bacterium]
MNVRSRVLYLPRFERLEDLEDSMLRAAFYLGRGDLEQLSFVVRADIENEAKGLLRSIQVHEEFDPAIEEAVRLLADNVRIVSDKSPDLLSAPLTHDVVVVWNTPEFDSSQWASERAKRTRNVTIFDVDDHSDRFGPSSYGAMTDRLSDVKPDAEGKRFEEMLEELQPSRVGYLFGSGPSIKMALDHDFSDGTRIVCNTVILNDDIMDHVRPHIVTFADPIFHFGPSLYAATFRKVLSKRLAADPKLRVVIPIRYRGLMAQLMPEYEDRFVGIPFLSTTTSPSLDLKARFAVWPAPNILTLLMLPLAATMHTRIGLVGFDGREPAEDGFWKHDASTQIGEHMAAIRRTHLGFFELDYDDYYDSHISDVDRLVTTCESRGIAVESLTPSFVPPLKRRQNVVDRTEVGWEAPSLPENSDDPVVVSIDPDWDSAFGHYGPWFRALSYELGRSGTSTISLASRAIVTSDDRVLPTFSYPTTNPLAAPMYAPQFEVELASAVRRLVASQPDREFMFHFSCADVWHLPALIRVFAAAPERTRVHVNLMRAHKVVTDIASDVTGRLQGVARALRGLLEVAERAGVRITVDTDELRDVLSDVSGITVGVMPMAAAVDIDPDVRNEQKKLMVYCPAQSQRVKGVIEFAQAAKDLQATAISERAEFRMRLVRQPYGTPVDVAEAISDAETAGLNVIHGTMSDSRFAEVLGEADIVVVPYQSSRFRTRTTAAVVDAVRAGIPVVTSSGTWGESVMEESGAGVSFRSGDAADLARAITEAVNRYPALAERAKAASVEARRKYSMSRLADYITADVEQSQPNLSSSDLGRTNDMEAILVAQVQGRLDGTNAVEWALRNANRATQRETRRADSSAIRIEQQQKVVEQLRRSIESRDEKYQQLKASADQKYRQLETNSDEKYRKLEVENKSLKVQHAELVSEYESNAEAAHVQVESLNREIEILNQRFGNRVMSALRRLLKR